MYHKGRTLYFPPKIKESEKHEGHTDRIRTYTLDPWGSRYYIKLLCSLNQARKKQLVSGFPNCGGAWTHNLRILNPVCLPFHHTA